MPTSPNTSKWYDRLWASLIYFTRLPFWRLHEPPREAYESVVEQWPLTGWLTGGVMAAVLWLSSYYVPYAVAVVLAIVARLLLTGAFHEDGLADFFDGFGGGGRDRQLILNIMKDSHIGTYGVLSLIVYMLLLFLTLYSLPAEIAALAVFAGDPFAKMMAAQMVTMMPYARTEETAKSHTVYRKFSLAASISLAMQGLLPFAAFIGTTYYLLDAPLSWAAVAMPPCLVMYLLYMLIWRRLRGYTGDCCGAMFLLIELSFYLCVLIDYGSYLD